MAASRVASWIELRSLNPGLNRFRSYRIIEQPTLFGGCDLIIEWGRLGRQPRIRIERFTGMGALAARRNELLRRRARHGYIPV